MKPLKEKLSITLDRDLVLDIKLLADLDDRNFSAYINRVLKQHVEANAERLAEYKARLANGNP